ncbi:MAG TPA: hypothetical protein VI953_01100 [Candidatus Paceibacterota bacterium]
MRHKLGRLQKEVLARLYSGAILGLHRDPSHNRWVVRNLVQEWEEEERKSLNRAIASLYESRLVTERHNADETVTLVLSDKGHGYALTANLDEMEIPKPKHWDEKWRVVLSDIPEKRKATRDALREHLKQLDFIEFQKSVWVHAYDCRTQVEFLIEFYGVKRYVRYGLLEHIDNDLHLREQFDLI